MKEQIWDTLIKTGMASEESLKPATWLNGYSLETMESVLYALTGCRNLEQFYEGTPWGDMHQDEDGTLRMACGCTEANVLDGNHNVCGKDQL